MTTADKIEMKPGPFCPDCGEPMDHYGGTAGYIHCGWKLLYRSRGWFEHGSHVQDSRLAGPRQEQGIRCVAGVVQER